MIAVQVAWARDFRGRYPKLGAAMRVLTTAEDTPEDTSFETYLRGELGTYSDRTMALYEAMVENLQAAGRNLTEQTVPIPCAWAGSPILRRPNPPKPRRGYSRGSSSLCRIEPMIRATAI